MIITIIITVLTLILVLYTLKLYGHFGLQENIRINQQMVYYYYKGEVIHSYILNISGHKENLLKEQEAHRALAFKKVSNIKKLKSILKQS